MSLLETAVNLHLRKLQKWLHWSIFFCPRFCIFGRIGKKTLRSVLEGSCVHWHEIQDTRKWGKQSDMPRQLQLCSPHLLNMCYGYKFTEWVAPTGWRKQKWEQCTFKKTILSLHLNVLNLGGFYLLCCWDFFFSSFIFYFLFLVERWLLCMV